MTALDVPAASTLPTVPTVPTYEDGLPPWQRSLNRFAENWIFAVVVAMAVRHFIVEPFRIPTASMEPMLYGDPAFTRGDTVVVDKLMFRFRKVQRWDVTVFQYPHPEIKVDGVDKTAFDSEGKRADNLLSNPLSYRNFVKRAVILPGDVFYIANGDVFLKQQDGSFHIARKPPEIQDAIFQDIYRHGVQKGYKPWLNGAGCGVALDKDGQLSLMCSAPGKIDFSQPLRNLYVKDDGSGADNVLVAPFQSSKAQAEAMHLSMLAPQFEYRGKPGNLWDLDKWTFWRLTSDDLDNPTAQSRNLNETMREMIGDVRVNAAIADISGEVVLTIAEGAQQRLDLHLWVKGWRLERDGAPIAAGDDVLKGATVALSNVDDQALLWINGVERHRSDIAAVDPQLQRTAISWSGVDGKITFAALSVQRDVHYCANGFLRDEGAEYHDAMSKLAAGERDFDDPVHLNDLAQQLRLIRLTHCMAHGVAPNPDKPEDRVQWEAWGNSEKTAVTAPADAYLMLGDNSPFSFDSRNWGLVPAENLRGRAIGVVFPFRHAHMVH